MNHEKVCKTVEAAPVTHQQLEQINRYTRRKLKAEEVFVFSIVLCDNEIDRDLERFPTASLEKLGELYMGKTGVFDHAPKAENQAARIFDTALEATGEVNSLGEPYHQLKAWAYMVRCGKNEDLILEIDAGIKKEVSVGCAVGQVLCSVCGASRKESTCDHRQGEVYDGRLCHHLLVEPTDAYEWSFVAVPAQKKAGVVKRGGKRDEVVLTKARFDQLEQLAKIGLQYERQLRKEVVTLALLSQSDVNSADLEGIVSRLDSQHLEVLKQCFTTSAGQRYPIAPQLARPLPGDTDADEKFRI